MKFYKRFPGDIMKKTSGLTMAQFGAYDRLMDWCYANEKAVDPDEAYIITHAITPSDRRDVDKVLAKFFSRDAEGYRQERIEEVIADALPRIQAARENGKKGGRPVTKPKPTGLSDETQTEPNAKASQSQSSSIPSEQKKPRKPRHPCPEGVHPQVWDDWLELRRVKRAVVTQTVIDGAHLEAAKAGMTLEAFLRVWCRRGSQGLEADWLKPHERNTFAQPAETAWQRSQRERAAEVSGGLVSRKPPGPETIDNEVPHAALALRVG